MLEEGFWINVSYIYIFISNFIKKKLNLSECMYSELREKWYDVCTFTTSSFTSYGECVRFNYRVFSLLED